MAVTTKKTATPATTTNTARRGLRTPNADESATSTPSKSPTRTPATGGAANPTAVNRTRSVRSTAPPSARAAVRKTNSSNDTTVEDDAKAELQAQIEELHAQVRKAEEDAAAAHSKSAILQTKLDEAMKDQGLLEENVHEHLEKINDLEVEKKDNLRSRREMEQIFESERAASIKEREESQAREDEMIASIHRLKETLAQKELRVNVDDERPGLHRNTSNRRSMISSPGAELGAQFAPSASLERSDSRSSSKLVMQKDKIIEELRLELAEAQIKLVEVENVGGGRLQQLESDMYQTKMQNARLMEENESFQLLLQEKTLNGDLANSELLRVASPSGETPPGSRQQGSTLADELEASEGSEVNEEQAKSQAEINALREQNRALTVYINNIITRLLNHGSFEHILDKTPDLFAGPNAASTRFQNAEKELPPPPTDKDAEPQGFLQRARSVMGARPSRRPQSQIFDGPVLTTGENLPPSSVHENPQTAPQIPLGRSQSTRAHGHRRANSDWGAASIVNNMYRGPTTGGIPNPSSPGLNSPTTRTGGFFTAPQPMGPPPTTTRLPSSSSVPTIPETGDATPVDEPSKDAARDSKISTNSTNSDPADATAGGEIFSNTSSPPRSVAGSSHDRDARSAAATSSVMVGSRMRPLRLVQENVAHDDEAAKKAANRGSWFGFMNRGV